MPLIAELLLDPDWKHIIHNQDTIYPAYRQFIRTNDDDTETWIVEVPSVNKVCNADDELVRPQFNLYMWVMDEDGGSKYMYDFYTDDSHVALQFVRAITAPGAERMMVFNAFRDRNIVNRKADEYAHD